MTRTRSHSSFSLGRTVTLKPDRTVCPSESPSTRANVPGGCEAMRVTSVMPGDTATIVMAESAKAAVATAGSDDLAK